MDHPTMDTNFQTDAERDIPIGHYMIQEAVEAIV